MLAGLIERVTGAMGGRARSRVVLVLAITLALDSADLGTIAAAASPLERGLGISHTGLGLLISIVAVVRAVAAVPAGMLADRVRRTTFLAGAVALWAGAQGASGLAPSFAALIGARVALGVFSAPVGPTIASLVGDYVPASDRGRTYGFILAGEFIGTGIGLLVASEVTAILSWRWAFWALAPLAVLPAWLVFRLPEPPRGAQGSIQEGSDDLESAVRTARSKRTGRHSPSSGAEPRHDDVARRAVREAGVKPNSAMVLHGEPERMSLIEAVRYVLRIPSNVLFIVASSLGYFFFAGLRAFAVVFTRQQFGVSQAVATPLLLIVGVGAVIGVLVGGRFGDRLIRSGTVTGRVLVGGTGYLAAVVLLAPGLVSGTLAVSVPLFFVAAAALSAPNPALDSARLDVVHHRVWGRAESVRHVARAIGEGVAPVLFGFASDHIAGGGQAGLRDTFLIMLAPLAAGGFLVLWARRFYPRDVASAVASERPGGR